MGEIAEAMLNGDLCEGCGCEIGLDQGFPGYCQACSDRTDATEQTEQSHKRKTFKCKCPECGKPVSVAGLYNHISTVHGNDAANRQKWLMVTARELLTALKNAESVICGYQYPDPILPDHKYVSDVRKEALRVIAKAEGRS